MFPPRGVAVCEGRCRRQCLLDTLDNVQSSPTVHSEGVLGTRSRWTRRRVEHGADVSGGAIGGGERGKERGFIRWVPSLLLYISFGVQGVCLLQLTCYRRDVLTSFDSGISSDPCGNAFRQHLERRECMQGMRDKRTCSICYTGLKFTANAHTSLIVCVPVFHDL